MAHLNKDEKHNKKTENQNMGFANQVKRRTGAPQAEESSGTDEERSYGRPQK